LTCPDHTRIISVIKRIKQYVNRVARIDEMTKAHDTLPLFIDHGLLYLREVERQEEAGKKIRQRVAQLLIFGALRRGAAFSLVHREIKNDSQNISLRFLEAWLRKDVRQCEHFSGVARRAGYRQTINTMKEDIGSLRRGNLFIQLRASASRHFARRNHLHGHPAP
jgi:hypothetical protein